MCTGNIEEPYICYMRKLVVVLFALISFGVQAQNNTEYQKFNPELKRFVYQKNLQINKNVYDSIYFDVTYSAGKKWVFMYSYRSKEYERIADDEYFESIIFEIDPPKGNSFSIKTGSFEKSKVVFSRSCFCPDSGIRQLYEGSINGKKIGKNNWQITYDIQVEPRPGREGFSTNKKLKGIFKPGKISK